MATTTTVNGIPVPEAGDANNVPADMLALATLLDSGSVVKRLTGAAIAALAAPQRPAGLVVYNTTTGKLQVSNGSGWDDVVTVPAWGAYTPTLTASTTHPHLGSTGTLTGRWSRVGNTVDWSLNGVAGGSGISAGSGIYAVSLPAAVVASYQPAGSGWLVRGGAFVTVHVAPNGQLVADGGVISDATGLVGAGDQIRLSGRYEAVAP